MPRRVLLELPLEILCVIFALVDTRERLELQVACKSFNRLIGDPLVWKQAFEYKFGTLLEVVDFKQAMIEKHKRIQYKSCHFSFGGDRIDTVEFIDNGIICGLIGGTDVAAFNFQGQPLGSRKIFDGASACDFKNALLVGCSGGIVHYGRSMRSNWKQMSLKDGITKLISVSNDFFIALTLKRLVMVNITKQSIYCEFMTTSSDNFEHINIDQEYLLAFTESSFVVYKIPLMDKTLNSIKNESVIKRIHLKGNKGWVSTDKSHILLKTDGGFCICNFDGLITQPIIKAGLIKISTTNKVVITANGPESGTLCLYKWDNGKTILSKQYKANFLIHQIAYTPLSVVVALANGKILIIDVATMKIVSSFSVRGVGPLNFWYNDSLVVLRDNKLHLIDKLFSKTVHKRVRQKLLSPRHDNKKMFQDEVDEVRMGISYEREQRLALIRNANMANGEIGLDDEELISYAMMLSMENGVLPPSLSQEEQELNRVLQASLQEQ